MAGLESVVVFWTGWGIHFTVLVSFTVQVTLLLASDFRRRRDSAVLKVVIWSAYVLADTTAIFALGHMSVLCNWSPEKQLMALWAPLLLVHLGGQDNITAYAMEDNRLWLRHLQTFVLQVAAAGYVMYVSSILSHPSKVRSAAILMFLVGILKYGERIWALMRADSCASSSLSATSYDKHASSRTPIERPDMWRSIYIDKRDQLIIAYTLLDVPKLMFEGPTSYVETGLPPIHSAYNFRHRCKLGLGLVRGSQNMLRVVKMQLWMMYDLLYTKASVVHTWYGLCSRVFIWLFTVTALALFRSSPMSHHDKAAAAGGYKRGVDVAVTNVLLVGAVVLETMSVLKAIFSKWTAVLLLVKEWYFIGGMVSSVEAFFTARMEALAGSRPTYFSPWSSPMRQHSLFKLCRHSGISRGSKMAKKMGVEDWWDSNVYSWSLRVSDFAIAKVLELVSTTEDITESQGLNAVRRYMNNSEQLAAWIWLGPELKLEERILVWHIATHVYIWLYTDMWKGGMWKGGVAMIAETAKALANYMFFLLAARPYMLPYPVSRQAYVQLCHDAVTHLRGCTKRRLVDAILNQKQALVEGTPLQPDKGIGQRQGNGGGETTGAAARPQPQPQPSMNSILDRGCQLAAKLIHITATAPTREKKKESRKKKQRQQDESVDGNEVVLTKLRHEVVVRMVLEVWAEMLCYTANLCNENYHAKHLTEGGDIMTIITLMMIYIKNGLTYKDTTTSSSAAIPPSCQGAEATGTDVVVELT